jgi:hypothetical protein
MVGTALSPYESGERRAVVVDRDGQNRRRTIKAWILNEKMRCPEGFVDGLPDIVIGRRQAGMLGTDLSFQHVSRHVATVDMRGREAARRIANELDGYSFPRRSDQRL